MIYNLSNELEAQQARVRLEFLTAKGLKVEITERRKKRTIDQNSLLHLWFGVFAEHIGEYSLEDCKRDVKRHLIGMKEDVNHLTGEVIQVDYKTSQMDTKELSIFMDKFKAFAQVEYGCYLPYFGDAGYEQLISQR